MKRHERRAIRSNNTEVIANAGIEYIAANNGAVLLIREEGLPKIDYYPSTSRWKIENIVHTGSVNDFIEWYQHR